MIGQYLSNTNGNATVAFFKKFWQLNTRAHHPGQKENIQVSSLSIVLASGPV
jgi:hypothetical protein